MNSSLKWLSNCVYIFSYFLVAVILASCTKNFFAMQKALPSEHVWQYLTVYGEEEPDYATYSYVLVGRDHSNEKSTSLYYDLIKAIQASTVNIETLNDIVSRNALNLFIIPKSGTEPDYELSKSLLASLSTASPLKFSRPGPYIITLYRPISSINSDDKISEVLYIDLTDAHLKAIPEIVRTYREQVMDEELEGVEKLKSLRLSLLNIGLQIEDSIGFAKSAYAGMRSAFRDD